MEFVQLPGDINSIPRDAQQFGEEVGGLGVGDQAGLGQFCESHHTHEHVVEVMRDPSGDAAGVVEPGRQRGRLYGGGRNRVGGSVQGQAP
jgi:hypothetical protein